MKQHSVGLASLLLLTFLCNYIECGIIIKRQIIEDPSLNPEIQEIAIIEDEDRDKRAVGGDDGKFALKNALLGFVFNKINSFIDQKTAWINKLDKINIAKNNAAGVIPPEDTAGGIAGAISGVIGSKLQQATPLISLVATKLTSGSLGGSSGGGGGLGGLLSGGLA